MLITKNQNTIIDILQNGGVGIILTDTVYGLVASTNQSSAVKKLYDLKNREHKPGTIIAASVEQLSPLKLDSKQLIIAKRLWPGPISFVFDIQNDFSYLDQSTGSIAIRVVSNPKTKELLVNTGPLLTSSANKPNQPTSRNISEAIAYFGDEVDFYLDGGESVQSAPSTIVKIVDNKLKVLRQGLVNIPDNTIDI